MSNPPHGSSGGPPLPSYHMSQTAGAALYRRPSYSAVAAGATNSLAPQYHLPSSRPSQFHNPTTSGTSYPPVNTSSLLSRMHSSGLEGDGLQGGASTRTRDGAPFASTFGGFNASNGENHKNDISKPQFFIPTYLRGSRYAECLEDAHRASLRSHHESRSPHSSNPGSLSASSSSLNLPKMVPSHRGITQDIIERIPPPMFSEESLPPLPSRWNDMDKSSGLDVMGNGQDLKYTGLSKMNDEAAAIRADHPMPRQCGIYYFEVQVMSKSKDGLISIGFSGSKVPLNRLPGWEPDSWAYHGDDGFTFQSTSSGKPYGPKYSSGDVIGCGVNFRTGCAFFTKNGNYLGKAFELIKASIPIYPSVGMKKPNEQLSVNFGQRPFVFDIDNMIEQERWSVMVEVSETPVSKLHTPLNAISTPMSERQLIHKLIAQYLAHDGYVETAHAFAQEVYVENEALANGSVAEIENLRPEEDRDAVNRQKIRSAILDGDIDRALYLTEKHFPKVLRENENIYFRLRCRKYVEMIRQATELQDASGSPSKKMHASNGRVHDEYDVFDHQMELDEQLGAHRTHNGTSMDEDYESAMDTSEDGSIKLLDEALHYGQELKAEFNSDPRKEVKRALDETLALIAYSDPRDSPLRSLLEEKERIPVAEELNSAILVALGKSAASVLERVVQQTVVLLNDLGEDGGPGAFLNVRKFLQDEEL